MGYDCERFLNNVDDELLCSICMLVIEDPVQTHCEHFICNKCIKDWLCVNKRCPVDSRPLTTNDLSDPYRVLRNMLNKLDIKCDFQSVGCQTITKLENLGHHVTKCEYNLNGHVVCDRGCNVTMTRQDYQKNDNCVSHLAKEVAEEVTKLRDELSEQKCHFERTVNRQVEEITKLRHKLSEQKCNFERTVEEIRKLCGRSNRQKELVENAKTGQKQEIVELCADILLSEPPKWQQTENIKIGPLNLLEKENPSSLSYVQSAHTLEPTKSCFKIYCRALLRTMIIAILEELVEEFSVMCWMEQNRFINYLTMKLRKPIIFYIRLIVKMMTSLNVVSNFQQILPTTAIKALQSIYL